jgi:hypothetical protein
VSQGLAVAIGAVAAIVGGISGMAIGRRRKERK